MIDLMTALVTAGVWVGASLLAWAGVAKLHTPDGAMAALFRLGLPSGRGAARLLGLGEITVAVVIVVVGGPLVLGAAVLWAALTAVAVRQRASQIDCGCFGVRTYPITPLHIGINAANAVVALGALAWPPPALGEVLTETGALAVVALLALLPAAALLVTSATEHAGLAEGQDLTAR